MARLRPSRSSLSFSARSEMSRGGRSRPPVRSFAKEHSNALEAYLRSDALHRAGATHRARAHRQGPRGPDETLGMAMMSALVLPDGDLYYGAGAVSSEYDSTREIYIVRFNRSVTGCTSSRDGVVRQVIASSSLLGDSAVVDLRRLDGSPVKVPRQLIVFCWPLTTGAG
jgi:hypothetical protein